MTILLGVTLHKIQNSAFVSWVEYVLVRNNMYTASRTKLYSENNDPIKSR
jgi:hypothetical protein